MLKTLGVISYRPDDGTVREYGVGVAKEPRQRRDNGSEFEPEIAGAGPRGQGAIVGAVSIGEVEGNIPADSDTGAVGKAKLVVSMSSFWTATASFS
jgi:hypothetical protein